MDLGNGELLVGDAAVAVGHCRDDRRTVVQIRRSVPRDHARLKHQLCSTVAGRPRVSLEDELLPRTSPEVRRLTSLVESVDGGSPEHSRRVGLAAELVAHRMGLDARFIELIRDAAPLHDVGKLETPAAILNKPGPLTVRERIAMERHAAAGEAICRAAGDDPALRLAARVARSHHERWDGRGYPDGLAFDSIPLAARIVAVVDVYDALVTVRPYKGAWAPGRALEFLFENAGSQFDPDVVAAFVTLVERGELKV